MAQRMSRVVHDDAAINRMQDYIEQHIGRVTGVLSRGGLVQDVALKAGQPNGVTHGLGVVPIGYIIIDQSADARVWRTYRDDLQITLQTSNDCIVSLWVFG